MIEPAQIQDCADIIYVIQKSILSCVLDHQNNTQIIADWLANKTVEQLSSWMQHNPLLCIPRSTAAYYCFYFIF